MHQLRLNFARSIVGLQPRRASSKVVRVVATLSAVMCTSVLVQVAPVGADPFPGATTFSYTGGEQSYVVPAGITLVQVEAVGGNGSPELNGGVGADVVVGLPVTPGETLFVEVGATGGVSSFGGGASGGGGGGSGGGASDVLTCSRLSVSCAGLIQSLDTRVVVAGGGGGGGDAAAPAFDFGTTCGNYGGGGNASLGVTPVTTSSGTVFAGQDAIGAAPALVAKGGQTSEAGSGGVTPDCSGAVASFAGAVSGSNGVADIGGAGASPVDSPPGGGGGGGGGGYFGGGGGSSGQTESAPIPNHSASGGGGGGAGSSFYAASVTGDVSIGHNGTTTPPSVTMTPLIGISSPTEGATYQLHSVVNASFACQPLVGGCGSATVPNNTAIDTSTVGAHTFAVTTDNATSTIHYSVAAPPTIVSAVLSSSSVTPIGGAVTLSAHVTDADTCAVTFVPAIASPPAPWNCSGASSVTHTMLLIPSNSAPKTVSETVTFTATGTYSDGTSTSVSTSNLLSRFGYAYYAKHRFVSSPTYPTSISCPTATFCAQSGTKGYVGTITPSAVTWTHQDHLNEVNAVSCVAGPPIFCLAVDGAGQVMSFDGKTWSAPKPIQAGKPSILTGVSCVEAVTGGNEGCIIVSSDQPGQLISSWGYLPKAHEPIPLTGFSAPAVRGSVVFVSCWATHASAKNCALVNSDGAFSFWSGSASWSAPSPLFSDNGTSEGVVSSLSCSTDGVCVAGDSHGGTTAFRQGRPLSIRQPVLLSNGSISVTCLLDTYCLATDDHGNFFQRVPGVMSPSGSPPFGSWAPIAARVKVQFHWDRDCVGKFTTAQPATCTAVSFAGGKEYVVSGQVKLAP